MVDYIRAIQSGISAARRVELAKAEVKRVLAEVSDQLIKATGGRLSLVISEEVKIATDSPTVNRVKGISSSFSAFHRSMIFAGDEIEKIRYQALSIVCSDPKDQIELSTWSQSQNGYPVKLQYSKKEITCRDHRSLEQGIEELLGDPSSGAAIERLLSRAEIDMPHSSQELDMSGDMEDI